MGSLTFNIYNELQRRYTPLAIRESRITLLGANVRQ